MGRAARSAPQIARILVQEARSVGRGVGVAMDRLEVRVERRHERARWLVFSSESRHLDKLGRNTSRLQSV